MSGDRAAVWVDCCLMIFLGECEDFIDITNQYEMSLESADNH